MVLPNDGPGGMQAQVHTVAVGLAGLGHHVVIVIGGGDFDGQRNGVQIVRAPRLSSRRPLAFLRFVRRVVRREAATIVHGHGLRTGPIVAWAGRSTRRYVTCHGIDPVAVPTGLLRLLRLLPVSVLACGAGPARQMAACHVSSRILDNALAPQQVPRSRDEFNRHFDTRDDEFVALWPARFSTQKGHAALLEFAESLRETSVRIICCGDGPLRNQLQAGIKARSLSDIVSLRDFEPNASAWLAATDFFVLPSLWEGQPLVMLEAMRAGVPILSWTPIGVELLHPSARVTTPREAATVLKSWLGDSSIPAAQIAAHREVAEHHELPIILRAYETLYCLS